MIAISASGPNLDSPVDLRFGRALYFILCNPETLEYEAVTNPFVAAGGGAGIQAAQLVGNRGVKAVISGVLGPNAYQTLQAIGIPCYQVSGGTVRQAVEAFKAGQLSEVRQPGPPHMGMGRAGMGRGRGMGAGRAGQGGAMWRQSPGPVGAFHASTPPQEELTQLKEQAKQLSDQLDAILKKIQKLEQEQGTKRETRDDG